MPPVEHRFQPGQSGNPKGRAANAGSTVREWMNQLAADECTEEELRAMARDPKLPFTKRSAANYALTMLEMPDVADFETFLEGVHTLSELREMGLNTAVLKRVRAGDGDAAAEVELHDRARTAIEGLIEQTDGRPNQRVNVTDDSGALKTLADGATAAAQLLAGIRERLGIKPD